MQSAQAFPSFAWQTGQSCEACHADGQFPEPTPYGRLFKLTDYTNGVQIANSLLAMVMVNTTKTANNNDDIDLGHYCSQQSYGARYYGAPCLRGTYSYARATARAFPSVPSTINIYLIYILYMKSVVYALPDEDVIAFVEYFASMGK